MAGLLPIPYEILLWVLALILSGFFIFSAMFVLIMIDDLQRDYSNPVDMTSKVNWIWWPDFGLYATITFLFLISGHWFIFLLHLPLAVYNGYLVYIQQHMTDPTTIHQGDNISSRRKISIIKLAWAVVCFIMYLFMLIFTAIEDIQIRKHDGNGVIS